MRQKAKIYIAIDDDGDILCAFSNKDEAVEDCEQTGANVVETNIYIESPGGQFIDRWEFIKQV
jgi:hypothetical protein